ncbi:MAG TPA: CpsD/CapB family tyrosine-protein kinase [Phycisphaerae bacterium]|nr:CpsD/CapB family tyrosine-protein kinase [Phycisphaerae bacterium]HOJ75857.1 CpsD/CapB family tyrosine-protein kinase [Phycisphaerae bacterium]HOM53296.1 CpsD/CapB family tyrosine-protein kinase [Phycisphaerae bacterium]HOQ85563.1 CpsD/CapB family tyrosine-protein kinase [Phycisphaerae bacterium]HPP28421.1 CpsD/CapB family tyrosine-protein kinase [Phycisphaerae bacterium]
MDSKASIAVTPPPPTPRLEPVRSAVGITPAARDEIEQLWGSVFFSAEHKAPRSVIVTGAEPDEGATEVAAALALVGASARHGHRVALVDFNLREPMVASLMGVPESPGVRDALASGELIGGTNVVLQEGQLTVVPAGRPDGHASAAVDPERVQRLIQHLLSYHDHVIVDAPSVNRNSTVQALAALTDGVLLVARQSVTRREALAEAKKRIELAQGKLIGLVLNMRKFPVPGFLYRRM